MTFMLSLMPFGFSGWAAGVTTPSQLDNKTRKRLIVLFQRGAVDGLSIVIPCSESNYFDSRPTISIPCGKANGGIELDSRFALHPALESVTPLWKDRSLAFVHACGSPNPSRSHFEAQDYMETGTPGVKNTKDGWLNRLLGILSTGSLDIRGISMGSITPRIMQGRIETANLPTAINPNRPLVTDRPQFAAEFEKLYRNDQELEDAYREGLKAHEQLIKDLEVELKMADHGAPYPDTFVNNCNRLAQVMAKDPAMQIAFLDVGGWDTHINQGGISGQLANHLKPFGQGIQALVKGLGDAYQNTLILVISEFGRTVKENGHSGTDHGHGNVLWAMGGNIKGGKVYGQWPGLSTRALYENRDLAITTDFRQVIGYLLGQHFQLAPNQVSLIFPKTPLPSSLEFNSLKAMYSYRENHVFPTKSV